MRAASAAIVPRIPRSALVSQRALFDAARRVRPDRGATAVPPVREPHSDGHRPTLEARLEGVWEGLSAAGVAPCPVCGSEMRRVAAGGRCTGCAATLS